MIRTQVQLTEEQVKTLKEIATRKGVSVSEIVRQSIENTIRSDMEISYEERCRRALEVMGKFRSGKSDVSVNHDKYLAEAFKDWCFL